MKKILLTGSTGFIGYNILKILLEKNDISLKLFVHKRKSLEKHQGVEYVYGDIRNLSDVDKAVCGCDIIYHTAGLFTFNPKLKDEIYAINVGGTENICEAAVTHKVKRFIYTSSAATIGKSKSRLSNEKSKFNLWEISSDYKKSKVLAEDVVLKYFKEKSLPAIILNPSLPIGKFDFRPTPTGNIVKRYIDQKIILYTDGGFNFVNVKDVAYAHYLAEQNGKIGQKYIIGYKNLTLKEFYSLVSKIDQAKKHIRVPFHLALSLAYLNKVFSVAFRKEAKITPEGLKLAKKTMFYDNSKSISDLGMKYSKIEKGIRDSILWFKNQK